MSGGVTATYSADNLMVCLFDGGRMTLSKAVALANRQRSAQRLPPSRSGRDQAQVEFLALMAAMFVWSISSKTCAISS